jgi:RHS repeat-associated protein
MYTKTKHWASITAGILSLAGYASAALIGSEKYTYDASGNIVEKSIDGKITKMSHDDSNKITSVSTEEKGSEQIIYDTDSRPVSYQDAIGHPTRQLSYGYEDKVLATETVGKKTEFLYNAEGNLVAKLTKGDATSYTWDGIALAAKDEVVFTNEDHITGGIPLITEGFVIVISDILGTTLSFGEVPTSSTAYGEGLTEGRFTSKIFISELNSYLFPCRLYSASAARWTTKDPTGFPDGANNHAYALNDPTGNVDPLGTVTWSHYGPVDLQAFKGTMQSAPPAVALAQTDQADQSGGCHLRKITQAATYTAGSLMTVPSATYYLIQGSNVLSSTAAFRGEMIMHEQTHLSLKQYMAARTYLVYENWSAGYESTNLFKSPGEALSAFNKDVAAAQTATISKYDVNLTNDNAPGHPNPGGKPGPQSGTRSIGGITYNNYPMVGINSGWGGPAAVAIANIPITLPAKTKGNCEQ